VAGQAGGRELLMSVLIGLVLGAAAGAGLRLFLRRLRRGALLPVGPLEAAGALTTSLGLGLGGRFPTVGLVLFAGLLMVALSAVDIVHHRLPDAITLPALPLAIVVVAATHALDPGSGSLLRAALCAAVLWALFAVAARISPAAMGRGDVKLIPTLGLLLGYVSTAAVVVGLAIAFLLGSMVAIGGLALRRLKLTSAIPLGPYLLFGCWCALLLPVS